MPRTRNRRLVAIAAGALSAAVVLTGCAADNRDQDTPAGSSQEHSGMDHPADGGPVPEGMTEATDPTYPVGTEVTLTANHMDGMNGATATVVGAYDTYTYTVDYIATTGGDPITDHKWVVHEELVDVGDERLPDGSEVTLAAAHMDGMDGATAAIASSTDEPVYIVDYEADGMTMTNHEWVVESEIQPAP